MVYGVRNNTTVCYYKDFLVNWFAKRPESKLYLACSRDILSEQMPPNIIPVKGYVTEVLSRFDLDKFEMQKDTIMED